MDASEVERVALLREIQACDVRLDLLPPQGQKAFREELLQRREAAMQRLALLEPAAATA